MITYYINKRSECAVKLKLINELYTAKQKGYSSFIQDNLETMILTNRGGFVRTNYRYITFFVIYDKYKAMQLVKLKYATS